MSRRLDRTAIGRMPEGLRVPGYDPRLHRTGIVHLGPGAFHRAHQAAYTDAALEAAGGDWRITGVSLRSADVAEQLNPQDGLYTLLERGAGRTTARLIGSIAHILVAPRELEAVLAAMVAPETRIVSLTITEKAYGISRVDHRVIPEHPAIAPDLATPRDPRGAVALMVEALRLRREAGVGPFTVLCCDNLSDNGEILRAGVLDFAGRIDETLRRWIEAEVPFPSTMVDRITPAATDATRAEAAELTRFDDHGAIETEAFSQWVIEDRFAAGRPQWEVGGAIFVEDVAPYEKMKLRMLNGSHSMLAYTGYLSGRRYVRDVMEDPVLAALVQRHMAAAADTLPPLPGIDLRDYARDLTERFANPAIAHETFQIAMDGTEKLPQRLLAPAAEVLARGRDIRPFAFAVAGWMRYALGRDDHGRDYELRDPRHREIARAVSDAGSTAENLVSRLQDIPDLFPEALVASPTWNDAVTEALSAMLAEGMAGALAREAARA